MSGANSSKAAAAQSRRWDELARAAKNVGAAREQQEDLFQLLTFEVDSTPYAIPVERVREIVRVRPIASVPRVPDAVRGVISLRGEIVQVVDLRRRLNLGSVDSGRATRIIVVHGVDGRVSGILVDAVREVSRVSEDALRPVSAAESGAVEALCVRGNEFISLIDLDRVLEIDAGN